jgi:hypothetical protein
VPEDDAIYRQEQRLRSISLVVSQSARGEQFTDAAPGLLPGLAV